MFSEQKKEEIVEFLKTVSPDSRVYLGCDSKVFFKHDGKRKVRWAKYVVVFVVHRDNSHGCKIFWDVTEELDYAKSPKRPSLRLMNEVAKVSSLYIQFEDVLRGRDVQVHLDINCKKRHISNEVAQQAIGYVYGTTGIEPQLKPLAWAASYAADQAVRSRL